MTIDFDNYSYAYILELCEGLNKRELSCLFSEQRSFYSDVLAGILEFDPDYKSKDEDKAELHNKLNKINPRPATTIPEAEADECDSAVKTLRKKANRVQEGDDENSLKALSEFIIEMNEVSRMGGVLEVDFALLRDDCLKEWALFYSVMLYTMGRTASDLRILLKNSLGEKSNMKFYQIFLHGIELIMNGINSDDIKSLLQTFPNLENENKKEN